jgi:hypothetical protein
VSHEQSTTAAPIQNDGGSANLVFIAKWASNFLDSGPEGEIYLDTLEGTMRADVGDWVIKGVKGEFYPCKPDIFEATYEPE